MLEATPAQLAELLALQPVYDELRADQHTRPFLDEILTFKTQIGAPPQTVTCNNP